MTNFRAELQALVDAAESFAYPIKGHRIPWQTALDRARAALAPPNDLSHLSEAEFQALCPQGYHAVGDDAEPQGEEPTDEELQDLWRSLMKAPNAVLAEPMIAFARAVLARWGHQPAPPAEGEVGELVDALRDAAFDLNGSDPAKSMLTRAADLLAQRHPAPPAEGEVGEVAAWLRVFCSEEYETRSFDPDVPWLNRAADLLEQRHPTPVPVSERLPGDQLCWWYEPDEDDDGSGYGGKWTLLRIRGGTATYTHWLPAHALPLPQGEVEQ